MRKELKIGLIFFSILLGLSLLILLIIHLTNSKTDSKTCNASSEIQNGSIGDCTSNLVDGATCYPICNSGYTLSGNRKCSNSKLTDTAKCNINIPGGSSCDASGSIPNGTIGDCTSTLVDGATCYPICNSGYTLSGNRTCNNGSLSIASCEQNTPGDIPPTYDLQQESSVFISSNSKSTMKIYLEYANYNPPPRGPPSLDPPTDGTKWKIIYGNGILTDPINFYNSPAPYGVIGTLVDANDVGSATWQILTLEPNKWVLLTIPNFPKQQAWSIRPLKYNNEKPCVGGGGDCGMPILIESGKDMVGDMSAVDGVNYLLKYTLSTKDGPTTIDFNSNPCSKVGLNPKGCRNPSVNGQFRSGTQWDSEPCPAGTCNTIDKTKTWCDAIHNGQCANSNSNTDWKQTGGPSSCRDHNLFTTYCYTHDDASSSPAFNAPYKMRLTYSDLE